MKNSWKYVKPLVNRDAVRDFIKQNNVELPDYLIQCIEGNNGGRPEKKDFITEQGVAYVFNSLLSYNDGEHPNIKAFYPDKLKGHMMYPVGITSGGDLVCYNIENQHYQLYNHETGDYESIVSDFEAIFK